MRHTFARQALVVGVSIEVVSDLAGHQSLATTILNATQELAQKIETVQGMKMRVARFLDSEIAYHDQLDRI
jgi:site-specific recombinase XerD